MHPNLREGQKKYWEQVRAGLVDSPQTIKWKNKRRKEQEEKNQILEDGEKCSIPTHKVLNLASYSISSEYLASKTQILENAKHFERETGVYFLISKGEIVYIGQSVHIKTRADTHRNSKQIEFDSIAFVPCDKKDLDLLESLYIYKFNPIKNGNNSYGSKAAPVSIQQIYQLIKENQNAIRK